MITDPRGGTSKIGDGPNAEHAVDKRAFVIELSRLARALLIHEPDATESLEVRISQAIDAGIQKVPDCISPQELSDLISIGADAARQQGSRAINIRELLSYSVQPREWLLEEILSQRDLMMIHAWRGLGKSQLALAIAYAVSSGGPCVKWRAPKARPVIYVDGELPVITLQERMTHLISGSDLEPPDPNYLQFITPDIMPDGLVPNLARAEGQAMLDNAIQKQKSELVIVDSISTLCNAGRENEAESWLPIQEYALKLRRRGIAILFIHHDGKGGQQRGTSRREDILDTTIHLVRPSDYNGAEGARFEVHFTKTRGLFGDAVTPFEATMTVRDGRTEWSIKEVDDLHLLRVAELRKDGMSFRDIRR
jgi:putative DNA primase/helicase